MTKTTTSGNEFAGRELLITRLLPAPRELVFEVWTNPEHIQHWWGPMGFTNSISQMEVRPDGVWEFVMHGPDGKDYKNKSVFTEIKKPERLEFEHVSGPKFRVIVTFEEAGNQTLLTWRMIFETAAQLEKVIREVGAAEGLEQNVERLEGYLSDSAKLQKVPLVVEQTLSAPAEKVWKAITDRDQMQHWYFNLAEFRAEVGFEFRFTGGPSPEKQYLHICTITEVEPGKKLKYSWRYDVYEGESFVTFLLKPQGDKTLLRLSHEGLETFPANMADFARGNFAEGWNQIVRTSLTAFLEQ